MKKYALLIIFIFALMCSVSANLVVCNGTNKQITNYCAAYDTAEDCETHAYLGQPSITGTRLYRPCIFTTRCAEDYTRNCGSESTATIINNGVVNDIENKQSAATDIYNVIFGVSNNAMNFASLISGFFNFIFDILKFLQFFITIGFIVVECIILYWASVIYQKAGIALSLKSLFENNVKAVMLIYKGSKDLLLLMSFYARMIISAVYQLL